MKLEAARFDSSSVRHAHHLLALLVGSTPASRASARIMPSCFGVTRSAIDLASGSRGNSPGCGPAPSLLDHLDLALVKLARDAELDGGALQGVVLGLLDARLVVGRYPCRRPRA